MIEVAPPVTSADPMYPILSPAQMRRVQAQGRVRWVEQGEVLVEPGDEDVPFFLVLSGTLRIVQPDTEAEETLVEHAPGQFTGEVNLLSQRGAMLRTRVGEPGAVVQVDRDRLLALVQNDAELGQIFLRAFLLRRAELVARGLGDAVLVGSRYCAGTLRVREFLTRNGHPFAYIDLDQDTGAQALLDHFGVASTDVPVLICRRTTVLRNPGVREIADCLAMNPSAGPEQVRDVVVVGAGPAGLAAAVNAASEGLDVLVLEASAPGGQAGSSSRIENYLGFPLGISGQELSAAAYAQAQKFGAEIAVARDARRLSCGGRPYRILMDGEPPVLARSIVIATGAAYRKPPIAGLEGYEGLGVYYAATSMESQLSRGEEVVVVGGGNAAGQAAIFLANTAARVHHLVRADALVRSMSRYLVRRIDDNPAILLHASTELVALFGDRHLEGVQWMDTRTGREEKRAVRHVFLMTGADPRTGWLNGCVATDGPGFVRTGTDLSPNDLKVAGWPLARPPYPLETSLPGVFAVGDVRGGNIRRVASAVGEGSMVISFVHRVLAE